MAEVGRTRQSLAKAGIVAKAGRKMQRLADSGRPWQSVAEADGGTFALIGRRWQGWQRFAKVGRDSQRFAEIDRGWQRVTEADRDWHSLGERGRSLQRPGGNYRVSEVSRGWQS